MRITSLKMFSRFKSAALAVLVVSLQPFARAEESPLRVAMISGSLEYKSAETLPVFAEYLRERYGAESTVINAVNNKDLPGVEAALDSCDVALFFTRRLETDGEALERIKAYCRSGKPVVGVRTASHGFQKWLEMDAEILGGDYGNHFGAGPTQKLTLSAAGKTHPIFAGVGGFTSRASLYKNEKIAADCQVLAMGSVPGKKVQPAAWTREVNGGRVFYISTGAPSDFEDASFRRMLAQGLFWSAKREPVARPLPQPPPLPPASPLAFKAPLRSRVQPFKGTEEWRETPVEGEFVAGKTAVLICDLWDKHWCDGATERVKLLAEKMNPVLAACRAAGVLVVHAPSDAMGFYEDWPQRLRATAAPKADAPPSKMILTKEPPLPIDDKDGGCDTQNTPQYQAWTRQTPDLEIGLNDVISDNGEEVYNVLAARGIDTILYMGVHTNMCVLGRTFAIRDMTRRGMRCALIRDLTDSMYDPMDAPFVPHDQGTAFVVEHIEKYWCPSLTSGDLVTALQAAK